MTIETKNTDIYESQSNEGTKRELIDKLARTIKDPPIAPYARKNSSMSISD